MSLENFVVRDVMYALTEWWENEREREGEKMVI